MNNAIKIMIDMLSLEVCQQIDSLEVGANTDKWYHITWNPYMNNGEYEVFTHGNTEVYRVFRTSEGVMEYIS
jgi:hypothetical protein